MKFETVLPLHWDEQDKITYEALILQAQPLIGKKVNKRDEFLLDLSAKIAINKIRGYGNDMTPDDIIEQMLSHQQSMRELIVETPENLYEEGQHPLELNPAPTQENIITNQEIPEETEPEASNQAHPLDLNLIQ
jgi:hypothetical protein